MNTTHGLRKHPLYSVWRDIKRRCLNPKCKAFKNYGGRGVTVCKEWKDSLENFIEWAMNNGYKQGLDIDHEDNDKSYEPSNCRFVTRGVNNMNRRNFGAVKYRGVCLHKKTNKYRADVKVDGKQKYLGLYQSAIEASRAYNEYIIANNLPNQLNNV